MARKQLLKKKVTWLIGYFSGLDFGISTNQRIALDGNGALGMTVNPWWSTLKLTKLCAIASIIIQFRSIRFHFRESASGECKWQGIKRKKKGSDWIAKGKIDKNQEENRVRMKKLKIKKGNPPQKKTHWTSKQ